MGEGKKKDVVGEETRMEKSTVSQLSENNGQASLYTPRMVSIGPFYRDVAPMKFLKDRFLASLMSRNNELTLGGIYEELKQLVPDAKKFYESSSFEGDDGIWRPDFVDMLLHDGCFILELFFKWLNEDPDDLFAERYNLTTILSDLLLIKNQIPFTIIEKLFAMVTEKKAEGMVMGKEAEGKETEGMVMRKETRGTKEAKGKEAESMVMEKEAEGSEAEGKEAEGMVMKKEAERTQAEGMVTRKKEEGKKAEGKVEEGKVAKEKEAKRGRNAFLNLLVQFLMNDPEPPHPSLQSWPENIRHILDLCHYFLIFPEQSQEKKEEKASDLTTLPLWEKKLTQWSPTAQTPTQCQWRSPTAPDVGSLYLAFKKIWSPTADQLGTKWPPRQIPGAVELYEAGVKFKRNSSFKNLFDVKFVRGTLKIPPLQIDSNKKILLANLLALESQKTCRNQTVTSYITLMDSLNNTKEDVALLQHKGVIHNKLSSHKEAAVFFNQLGDRLSIDNVSPYFVELFRQVQLRYDSSLKQSWARLKHDYFNSFWSIISVVAGVILLSLTMVQTFFTVYPYYRPRS